MVSDVIVSELARLGLPDVLLFLLSFAVLYGLLSQAKIPNSREAQALIALAVSFLIILAAPSSLLLFISRLSSSLVLVLLGVLLLVVLLESFGLRKTIEYHDPRTGKYKTKDATWLTWHPRIFGAGLILVALLVFFGAGGFQFLGIQIPTNLNIMGILMMAGIIVAVLWMIQERGD